MDFIHCLLWSIFFISGHCDHFWLDRDVKANECMMVIRPISPVLCGHVRSVWTPDPAFNCTDRALLQTKRFCSGYNTACLTFSTASLPRKLCNGFTGFFFKKKESPKMRSNDLSPNKIWDSKQIADRGGISVLLNPPTHTYPHPHPPPHC